jgi:hypothetical protein
MLGVGGTVPMNMPTWYGMYQLEQTINFVFPNQFVVGNRNATVNFRSVRASKVSRKGYRGH